jgi:hypothetical protein
MKTKGTGGYVEFLWLQNVLFIISVVLVIFVFKADLKVAYSFLQASRPEPMLFLFSCTISLPMRLTWRLLASLPRRLPLPALNPRLARADSPMRHPTLRH